jgi:hypothetical protein
MMEIDGFEYRRRRIAARISVGRHSIREYVLR